MLHFLVLVGAFGLSVQQDIPAVAFSAGLTQHVNLSHSEVVKFDRIYTNIGSGYDSNTGKFKCPQSGVYVFQFHALSKQDKTVWLQLYHNYHYVVSVYGHTANDYSAGGNSVAIQLTKGDEVKVIAVDSKNGATTFMYGAPDEVYCTFSGYLVSPIFVEVPILGDEVKVIAVDSKNGATTFMYGAPDEVYCTFSGYLVSPIFMEIPAVG